VVAEVCCAGATVAVTVEAGGGAVAEEGEGLFED